MSEVTMVLFPTPSSGHFGILIARVEQLDIGHKKKASSPSPTRRILTSLRIVGEQCGAQEEGKRREPWKRETAKSSGRQRRVGRVRCPPAAF